MIKIPVFQNLSAYFEMTIDLAGNSVTLTLRWNIRNNRWHLSAVCGDCEIHDFKLVENWPILSNHLALFPDLQGDFIVIRDDAAAGDSITYDNFGNGWNLYFLTWAELAQWESDNGV